MTRYTVHGHVTVSAWTVVEAESEEEARQIASERECAQMVSQAFYPDDDEAWHIEADGEPSITEVSQ